MGKGGGPLSAPDGDAAEFLTVRGLKKYFPIRGGVTGRTVGFVRAVDDVDLKVARGKTLGLIGESGCGKTTVGRCLLRLIEPTDGTVRFRGKDMAKIPRAWSLTLAGGLLVGAVTANILALLLTILGGDATRGLVVPDIVLIAFGAPASSGAAAFYGTLGSWGLADLWAPLALLGLLGGVYGGGAAFEANRWRPAVLGALVVLASFQLVLGGAALALLLLSPGAFGRDTERSLRKDMQIVFQDPFGSLNPRMLVSRIVSEPLRAFRGEIADRYPEAAQAGAGRLSEQAMAAITADLISRVGLNPEHLNRFPHEFSGGQRQRICVARALALKPAFIVLDEPTSALDVSVQAQILNLLKEIQRERGLTYLFISHHLAVIRHMCDDVAVMYLGKIVEEAPNEALFGETMHPYTIALLSAIPSVDPESRRERLVLEGEIPSPANPPSGCRFHTRCSFAIERPWAEAEAEWDLEEPGLIRLPDPLAVPRTVRLVVKGEVVDPLAGLGTVAYEVDESAEGGVEIRVKANIERGAAARIRYRRYRGPCASQEPALLEVHGGHKVACHFKEEALEAVRRAGAEKRSIGAVIAEMREPLPSAPAAGPAASASP